MLRKLNYGAAREGENDQNTTKNASEVGGREDRSEGARGSGKGRNRKGTSRRRERSKQSERNERA